MNKSKAKTAIRYTAEVRRQIVERVRAGRKPSQLSREFDGGLTTNERQELGRLRRENRQLKVDREFLSKAAAWFAQETVPNSKHSSDL